MRITQKTIHLNTTKQFQIFPITQQVEQFLTDSGITAGLASVYSPHSTGAIRLNDNEPLLHQDFMKTLYRLVPLDISYGHDNFESRRNVAPDERSNGHAHLKAWLLGSSETVPISDGRLQLGQHQHIFFLEFDGGRARTVQITLMGE